MSKIDEKTARLDETFGPFWFLSTLSQFYFLFVPLCYVKKKLGSNLFFVCSLILSLVWWVITAVLGINEIRIWGSFFLQYLWEFSLGMVLADKLYAEEGEIKIRNSILVRSCLHKGKRFNNMHI